MDSDSEIDTYIEQSGNRSHRWLASKAACTRIPRDKGVLATRIDEEHTVWLHSDRKNGDKNEGDPILCVAFVGVERAGGPAIGIRALRMHLSLIHI